MSWTSRLPRITAELIAEMDVIAHEGADLVAAGAKDRVPVDTGRLRNAIHVEREGVAEYAVIAGDTEAFYGHIVEHGGVRTPPRPFLIPAAEAVRPAIIAATVAKLKSL